MQVPTSDHDFLELCKRSQLHPPSRFDEAYRSRAVVGGGRAADDVARAFTELGLLTPFQSDMLLQGRFRFTLGTDYVMLDQLGVGGMGTVYLCLRKSQDDLVAVKVLPAEQSESAHVVERFRREARAVAALDHPNIVRSLDAGHDGSQPFLVMEYVDGINLQDLVTRHGPLSVGRACDYISQAADGLQHAHDHGLIHRDIKPANLLLARDGTVKVLDLGLARFYHDEQDDLTRRQQGEGGVLGTADYVAPEQALDAHGADIRSDIYALGCTLYYLLSGRPPFPQGSVAQKLIAHQMRQPASFQGVRQDVSPKLEDVVIYKMMAKDKKNRYQEPREIVDALGPFAAVPAPPPAHELPESLLESDQSEQATEPIGSADPPAKRSARLRRFTESGLYGRPPESPFNQKRPTGGGNWGAWVLIGLTVVIAAVLALVWAGIIRVPGR